jgi:transposase-like protein
MGSSLPKSERSQEVNGLDDVRPRMAKAVTAGHTELRRVIALALERVGPLKSAAADMGIDRAQMYRQLQNGHLTIERLEALGPAFGAELGRMLLDAFGPLSTPEARARQNLRDVRRLLDEVEQLLEHVA